MKRLRSVQCEGRNKMCLHFLYCCIASRRIFNQLSRPKEVRVITFKVRTHFKFQQNPLGYTKLIIVLVMCMCFSVL